MSKTDAQELRADLEALQQQLGPWPAKRPPKGTDVPSLRAEIEWLEASMAFQGHIGMDARTVIGELLQADAELARHKRAAA
jgi:hypothetical protein